jgi:hypothetical protein
MMSRGSGVEPDVRNPPAVLDEVGVFIVMLASSLTRLICPTVR